MDLGVQLLWHQKLHQLLKCERTTVGRWYVSEHFHAFPLFFLEEPETVEESWKPRWVLYGFVVGAVQNQNPQDPQLLR